MINRLLMVAVIAGVLTGLVSTTTQLMWAVPLIHAAESFEAAGEGAAGHQHKMHEDGVGHGHVHGSEASEWSPADGAERSWWTFVTNASLAMGASLVMAGLLLLRGTGSVRTGVAWGAMGFVAFSLAPALGLPPELPGTVAADLGNRQAWWLSTASATLVAMIVLLRTRHRALRAAAVGLAILPHAIGAPHPDVALSLVPTGLQSEFVAASLLSMLVFWLVLGATTGYLFSRTRLSLPQGEATTSRREGVIQ